MQDFFLIHSFRVFVDSIFSQTLKSKGQKLRLLDFELQSFPIQCMSLPKESMPLQWPRVEANCKGAESG